MHTCTNLFICMLYMYIYTHTYHKLIISTPQRVTAGVKANMAKAGIEPDSLVRFGHFYHLCKSVHPAYSKSLCELFDRLGTAFAPMRSADKIDSYMRVKIKVSFASVIFA